MKFGKLNFRNAKFLALVLVAIFALSTFAGSARLGTIPVSNAAAACTPASYPCSSSLNIESFDSGAGVADDSAAVAALNAGQISTYDFQLTPSEAASLPSSYSRVGVPNSLYEIEINPENTTWSNDTSFTGTAFNPFYYPQVRQAFNYLMDRSFLVDSVLGGAGVPTVSVYGVDPDALTVANTTAKYASYLTDNIALANTTIYNALTAVPGVTYNSHLSPSYYYKGSPITIYVADRKDDPFRSQWAGAVEANLESVGFAVYDESVTLATALTSVFVENPVTGQGGSPVLPWDMYFGAYGGVYLYYGDDLQVCFDGANCAGANAAYSDNCGGLAESTWNTTLETPPDVIKLSCELDQLNLEILSGSYTTLAARSAILNNYTNLEVQLGTNDWAAAGFNVYGLNPSQLSGYTPEVFASPVLNTESYMTETSTTPLGVRYLTEYNINPVGLTYSGDEYSADLLSAEFPSLSGSLASGTGEPVPFGWTYAINGYSSTSSVPVPTSAVYYNASSTSGWQNVTSGATADLAVTLNFANLMQHDAFVDNEPLTMADIVEPYIMAENITTVGNPMYVASIAPTLTPELSTIIGLRVLNSTAIELYSSYYFVAPIEAVVTALGDFMPFRFNGMFPWTMWVAMSQQILDGNNVWAVTQTGPGLPPELTLVSNGAEGSSTDISNIETSLASDASSGYVPAQLISLDALFPGFGINPGTSNAKAYYGDANTFITTTVGSSNAVIGLGSMYLSAWNDVTTPHTAALKANSNFHLGPYLNPLLFAPAGDISVSTTVPATLTIGSSVSMTTLLTALGSTTGVPQSGVNVTVQLISGTSVVSQTRLVSGTGGAASYTVPSVPAGAYSLTIYASSVNDTIIIPQTYSTLLLAPTTSSSTTPTTTSTTTTTTSTTSTTKAVMTTTDYEIIAAVVVIIVVGAGVALFLRRKPAPTPTPA